MNGQNTPANPSRRRLAKGGLAAAPVVLASLSSKNAFALPYHCFVSGKLSNNMSPFGPNRDSTAPCTLPQSRSQVISALQPPNAMTFNSAFMGGPISIYINSSNQRLTTTASGNSPATLYQLLTGTAQNGNNPASAEKLEILRRGIVLYYNALQLPPPNSMVPLSAAQAIDLTKAAFNGTPVTFNTSIGTKTFSTSTIPTASGYLTELTG